MVDQLAIDDGEVQAAMDISDVRSDHLEAQFRIVNNHKDGFQKLAGNQLDMAFLEASHKEPSLEVPQQESHYQLQVRTVVAFVCSKEMLVVRFDVVADRFQQESNEALTSLLDKYLDLLHDFNDAFELEALGIKELSLWSFIPQG